MRAAALLLLALLAAPSAPAVAGAPEADAQDLLVLVDPEGPAVPLPPRAVPLSVVPGFVVLDAPPRLLPLLRQTPGVLRADPAAPLVRDDGGAPEAPDAPSGLRLMRADAEGLAGLDYAGRGVTVAVVDSGIDATHPDLAGRVKSNVRVLEGRMVPSAGDASGHGTHVAGIVGASGASSTGRHRGVAPACELVGVDISGRYNTATALLAYDHLFRERGSLGLDVVVNPWGRAATEARFDPGDPLVRAVDRLVGEGVVVVFAALNRGPAEGTVGVEAQDPLVLAVGATDAAGLLASYSARGARGSGKPDLVAMGDGVVGLRSAQSPPDALRDRGALHRVLSGTSQAAPHVAGVVALLREARPGLSPADAANLLRASAVDLGLAGPDAESGAGLVDARDALLLALDRPVDRGNVLLAGGVERYAEAADPAGAGPDALVAASWSAALPVKPRADRLAVEVDAPPGPLEVTLESGGRALATWTRDGPQGPVRGELTAPPPGVWTLRARGPAPVLAGVSSVAEVQIASLPPSAPADAPRSEASSPDAPGPSLLPWLALGAVGAGMVGWAGWRARRRVEG